MINYIIIAVSVVLLAIYILKIRKEKITVKNMVIIAMFSAMSFVLYMIPFIKYPQGGGITLFSMLPIMLLSILYGNRIGLTGGLIFGLLKLLNGAFIINPAQFLLDYVLSTMALGLAGTLGKNKKYNIIIGCLLATVLSVSINIISGAVYFGEYAPQGMNVWLYSFLYNASSSGVEGIGATIILVLLPIKRFIKVANVQ